jgi:hypothetical protein
MFNLARRIKMMDTNEIELQEEEITHEVRKRGDKWRVWYPDEGAIQTPFASYDKEGKLKTVIYSGGDSGKLSELFEEFSTAKEAIQHAKTMGADKIKLIKTKERKKKV